MNILSFESSCDESSAAVIQDGKVAGLRTVTQSVHEKFGGVVPELAGRSHLQLMDELTAEALRDSEISAAQLDCVCSTVGPGLVGSLLVGSNYARGLAFSLDKPFRSIHHLEAHLWSAEIESGELPTPFLVLLVSGGHTLIVLVAGLRAYVILGETLDDALGEAYDKVGKLLGLGFPAGAEVDRLAKSGDPTAFPFTPPLSDDSLNFSFSGLKTAVLYALRDIKNEEILHTTPDLLASFQDAALRSVIAKIRRAIEITSPRALVTAGGVAANSRLRTLLNHECKEYGIACHFPPIRYCMDNAAMIGYLAWKLEIAGIHDDVSPVRPRWPLGALNREAVAA